MKESPDSAELGASFRQARREFWVMIVTWIVFAGWTLGYNSLSSQGGEGPVEVLFDLPRWVIFGVVIPWILAVSVTVWFALCFMKDTPLGEEEEGGSECPR